jgi:hypothetical protein
MAEFKTERDESRTVHLVSQEGESFDVPISVAKMSELVKTMIDEEKDEDEAQEIPLPNVKSSILAKVVEFCQHHKSEAMTEIEKVGCIYIYIYIILFSSYIYSFFDLAIKICKYGRSCSRMVL